MQSKKRILSVTVERKPDYDCDLSHYGKYVGRVQSDYTIDRRHSEDCITNDVIQVRKLERIASRIEDLNDSAHYAVELAQENHSDDTDAYVDVTATSAAIEQIQELMECDCGGIPLERGTYEYFEPNHENYEGDTEENIRKYCRQDYERMESYYNHDWYCYGIVVTAVVSIPSGESSVQSDIEASCWGFESDDKEDHSQDLILDVKFQLTKLGFSKRAIAAAFKNLIEKDGY